MGDAIIFHFIIQLNEIIFLMNSARVYYRLSKTTFIFSPATKKSAVFFKGNITYLMFNGFEAVEEHPDRCEIFVADS